MGHPISALIKDLLACCIEENMLDWSIMLIGNKKIPRFFCCVQVKKYPNAFQVRYSNNSVIRTSHANEGPTQKQDTTPIWAPLTFPPDIRHDPPSTQAPSSTHTYSTHRQPRLRPHQPARPTAQPPTRTMHRVSQSVTTVNQAAQ